MATIQVNPSENIQQKINSAAANDALQFAPGTWQQNGPLFINKNLSFLGTAPGLPRNPIAPAPRPVGLTKDPKSTLRFAVGKGGGERPAQNFGIVVQSGCQRLHIEGLNLESNNGIIRNLDSNWQSFTLVNNRLKWGNDGTYFSRCAVNCTMPCAQSSVENNLFHDSPQADRTIECYGWSNLSGSYNLFRNVRDGFHVSEAGDNLRLNWNVGERWNRMPFEVQGHSQARGVEIRWNVFLDWLMPWNDSFGFSAPANDFIEPEYSDNYLKASRVSDWGTPQPGQTKRFGYAIEAGGVKGKCQRNVFIGPWVEYVATTMAKTLCQDNRAYGQMPPWGDKGYGGEPGDHGHGSVLQVNNTHDPNEANAPPLPAYAADALGLAPPDPQPEPEPPTVTVSNLTATAEYDKVKLAWAESGTNGSVTIRRHLKNGAPDPDAPDVVLAAGVRQYTDTRFTAHMLQYRWEFFYAVNGVQSSLVQVGLNPPPDPQPVGDSLDIVSVTTTQIRKGKHVGTTTVKTETPV